MNRNQTAANGELRLRRDQTGAPGRFLAAAEDAGDSVGFRQQGGVNDAEAEADQRPLDAAEDVGGTQHKEERNGVTEEDAAQQDVTQLAPRCPHYRRVVVA